MIDTVDVISNDSRGMDISRRGGSIVSQNKR
jgi:hypothetical protein